MNCTLRYVCAMVGLLALLATAPAGLRAERADSIAGADRDDFVTASLLTLSPTQRLFSAFGHVALRLQCPSHGLDYVFTLEADPNVGGLRFLCGRARAGFSAVGIGQFIADMVDEGRGIEESVLRLTPQEKQTLWRLLDEDVARGPHYTFDLRHNCTTALADKLAEATGERTDLHSPADDGGHRLSRNGDIVRHYLRGRPWAEVVYVSVMGLLYDDTQEPAVRYAPQDLWQGLGPRAQAPHTLLPAAHKRHTPWPSPTTGMALLLGLTIAVTLGQWCRGWRRLPMVYDGVLFLGLAVLGGLLAYVNVGSDVFRTPWNWCFLVLNPLPLLLYIVALRHDATCPPGRSTSPAETRLHAPAGTTLRACGLAALLPEVAAIALTPFIGQLYGPHALLAMAVAVRVGAIAMSYHIHLF